MPSLFITDGYTEDGYIAGVPGVMPALRFRFRPATSLERGMVADAARGDAKQYHQTLSEVIAKHLVSWDAEVEISTKYVEILKPAAFDVLGNIVLGYRASDIDPNWSQTKKDEYNLQLKKAAKEAVPAPIQEQAEAAKN